MKNINNANKKFINNSKGFLAADFLFSFVLVISCGIVVFALTFSLATIEISQYIVWSSARAYSSANLNRLASESAGRKKFENLSKAYPLLTGNGATSPWFNLNTIVVGEATSSTLNQIDLDNKSAASPEHRISFR